MVAAMENAKCILGSVVLFVSLLCTEAGVLRKRTHRQNEGLEQTYTHLDGDILDFLKIHGYGDVFGRVQRIRNRMFTGVKWPRSSDGNVFVPFVMDDSYSSVAKVAFMMSLVFFHSSTCIRFITRTNETDYVHIRRSTGCRSLVGHQGGPQPLELKYPECFDVGTIHHELLHALGFHHEHNRWDRDRYIHVLWENIEQRDKGEFKKRLSLNQRTPYDYNSVMHYSRLVGSKNGLPTMRAKKEVEFGTASSMSQSDVERLNSVYCSRADTPTL